MDVKPLVVFTGPAGMKSVLGNNCKPAKPLPPRLVAKNASDSVAARPLVPVGSLGLKNLTTAAQLVGLLPPVGSVSRIKSPDAAVSVVKAPGVPSSMGPIPNTFSPETNVAPPGLLPEI